jgi:two-component system sensor histidine kinase BaeS
MARPGSSGPIGLRLVLAFVAVALSAVALLAALTAAFTAADISQLIGSQRAQLTKAIGVAAGAAWAHGHRWAGADLDPVTSGAGQMGVAIKITDLAGRLVTPSPGFASGTGDVIISRAVRAPAGARIGTLAVRFSGSGLGGADRRLRMALLLAIAGAAGIAALLALLVALGVSRRITRPVGRLIEVARSRARGNTAARVGDLRAPAELRELATTLDGMADALGRQEQLRRDLVADVAHELRTPLAVLQAGHEALLDGMLEPTPGQLSSLRDEVLRLARMTDDLQTLAAADAAALRLDVGRHDLAEIAATAAESLAARFDAAEVTLARELVTVPVLADAGRLHQVITNLLGNAMKFTGPGGHVTLTAGPDGSQAVLAVADTGAGIPPDELPFIFDRFWRGRRAAGVAGSGVGLAVVAELVRAHDGDIDVMSLLGQGTRVTVTLPRALAGPWRRDAQPEPPPDPHTARRPPAHVPGLLCLAVPGRRLRSACHTRVAGSRLDSSRWGARGITPVTPACRRHGRRWRTTP